MAYPSKCHPHSCPFDSPACPEWCKCTCQRTTPDCVSVTAQQALNIRELQPTTCLSLSTRERVFGVPYDPKKDVDIPVPRACVDAYLDPAGGGLEFADGLVKDYVANSCCAKACHCARGSACACVTHRQGGGCGRK